MFMKITTADAGKYADIVGAGVEGYCVTAQTSEGVVYIHNRVDLSEADATNLAKVVGLAKQINPEHWIYWRTVYGSAAFEREEAEATHAADMIRRGTAHEEDFAGTSIGTLL